ncbi:MAG: type II toxin-antitoxin system VapC family toxin [Vicinamibacterales bacterium]
MTVYLDTSALVKLYVTESGSDAVAALVQQAQIVTTSAVAYAETRAALARLRRERRLTAPGLAAARRSFERDWPSYLSLDVTAALCVEAGALAEQYGLRGFDSIHLASFARIVDRVGVGNVTFSCFDDRLAAAARRLMRSHARH